MRIVIDRTFGFEIYIVVKRWRGWFKRFNEIFCDVRRPISFAIVDEVSPVLPYIGEYARRTKQ